MRQIPHVILHCIPDQKKKITQKTFGDTNSILNNAIISILDNCNVFMLSSFSVAMALGECPCS